MNDAAVVATLIEWPAKVCTQTSSVDFFPRPPANVTNVQLARHRVDGKTKRITQPKLIDFAAVGVWVPVVERVVDQSLASDWPRFG